MTRYILPVTYILHANIKFHADESQIQISKVSDECSQLEKLSAKLGETIVFSSYSENADGHKTLGFQQYSWIESKNVESRSGLLLE